MLGKEFDQELRKQEVRFTNQSLAVLKNLPVITGRLNHNYFGSEHLLWSLASFPTPAKELLANLGVDPSKVASGIEFIIGRGDRMVYGEPGPTPRLKAHILGAHQVTVDQKRRYTTPLDLLESLTRSGESVAAGILESLGVSNNRVLSQINLIRKMDGRKSESAPMLPSIQRVQLGRLKALYADPLVPDGVKKELAEGINLFMQQAEAKLIS